METNELVKALRVCSNTMRCTKCPLQDMKLCLKRMMVGAYDLIKEQAVEIQELRNSLAVFGQANAALRDKVPEWIPVKEKLPEPEKMVLLIVNGKVKNITLIGAYELGEFDTNEGWILEMCPEWKDPKVTHWMPLPEPPEEEKDEK
nr:MAG TPA: Protein of unknown function (DUF551) [Caudoviricetes sp.]